jgi:hypothetical protein
LEYDAGARRADAELEAALITVALARRAALASYQA